MLMAPNTGKRREKRIEGGDEFDARQGVDSSAHLKLEEDTVLTAGTASRRGTRLSSIPVLTRFPTRRGFGEAPIAAREVSASIVHGHFPWSNVSIRRSIP